jgi:hypothetical protein
MPLDPQAYSKFSAIVIAEGAMSDVDYHCKVKDKTIVQVWKKVLLFKRIIGFKLDDNCVL